MTGYADWTVTFFDASEGILLEEIYVGLSSPAAVSQRVVHKLATDERLVAVAGWEVRAIAVDFVDK